MPLKQTIQLINKFGEKLKNGTITDEELKELLNSDNFKKSEGYVDPNKPITNSNFSQWNGMNDFVVTIGAELSEDILHNITGRMVSLCESRGENTFMRNSTLEKAFLAYEMLRFPNRSLNHFQKFTNGVSEIAFARFQAEIKSDTDLNNFNQVILKPVIETQETMLELPKKIKKIKQLCEEYKKHLDKTEDKTKLVVSDKYQIVKEILDIVNKTDVTNINIANQLHAYLTPEKIDKLNKRRDFSSATWLVEKLVNLITVGLYSRITKGSFAFWKSHGEVFADKVEEQNLLKP